MKILLVDDSNLSRHRLKVILGEGYSYLEACNGNEALTLYAEQHPRLVILDLTMPGMSGLDTLKNLRELDPQALVLIGTADVQEMTHQKLHDLGVQGILVKPFDPADVQQMVADLMVDDIHPM